MSLKRKTGLRIVLCALLIAAMFCCHALAETAEHATCANGQHIWNTTNGSTCALCGVKNPCTHTSKKQMTDEATTHRPEYEDLGNGKHRRWKDTYWYCGNCQATWGKSWTNVTEYHRIIWDEWYIYTYCMDCDARWTCNHPSSGNKTKKSTWYENITDNGNGTHNATFYTETYDYCQLCLASTKPVITTKQIYSEKHSFSGGYCKVCGAQSLKGLKAANFEMQWEVSSNRKSIFITRPSIKNQPATYFKIAYNIYDDKGNAVNYFYSDEKRVAATPNKYGRYNVFAVITDGTYTINLQTGWITLDGYPKPKPLTMSKITSSISPDQKSFFINKPTISGGTGNYKIAYNIYDDKGKAINYFYSNDSRVAATPGKNGKYNVFVVVSDGESTVQADMGWKTLSGYRSLSDELEIEPVPAPVADPIEMPVPAEVRSYMRVTADGVPMLAEPDENAAKRLTLRQGDVVYVDQLLTAEDGTSYAEALYAGTRGYINCEYLRSMSEEEIEEYLASLEKGDEEPAEEPDEEPAEEPDEEPVEEPDETPAEEPDEEPAEEPDETPADEEPEVDETPAADDPAPDPVEEPVTEPVEE